MPTARADASWSRTPGTETGEGDIAAPSAVAAFIRSPKKLALVGGVVVFLVVVIVFATSGGSKSSSGSKTVATTTAKKKTAPSAKTAGATSPSTGDPGVTASGDEPTEPSGQRPLSQAIATNTGDTGATEPAEATTEPAEPATGSAAVPVEATSTTPIETKPAIAKPVPKRIGGKRVVLEYDNQVRDTKPAPSAAPSDQTAVTKARSAYNAGNQRLFAGDAGGAIRFYKQSLAQYPGYVAGYRGLGLAYMQAGDKANALQALRTYINSVPTAKDAPLIRKRIATLQAR